LLAHEAMGEDLVICGQAASRSCNPELHRLRGPLAVHGKQQSEDHFGS
jgi:hypothetical protein